MGSEMCIRDSTSTTCKYGSTFNVTEGNYYTFSVWAKLIEFNRRGQVELVLEWLDDSDNTIRTDTSSSLGTELISYYAFQGWNRYSITAQAPMGATKVKAYIQSSQESTSRLYATAFQLEEKDHVTSFTIGTRAEERLTFFANTLTFPMTIEIFAYVLSNLTATRYLLYIADESGNNQISIYYDGSWKCDLADGSGNTTVLTSSRNLSEGWHYFALTLSDSKARFYIDGELEDDANNPHLPTTLPDTGYVGSKDDGYEWDSYIASVSIRNEEKSSKDILRDFQAGYITVDDLTKEYITAINKQIPTEFYAYIPLGTYWTKEWDVPEQELYVKVTAQDIGSLLGENIYRNSFLEENKTFSEIARDILLDAGLDDTQFYIDPVLDTITVPLVFFRPMSHKKALKKVAEAGGAFVIIDRSGKLYIVSFETLTDALTRFRLNQSVTFRKVTPSKQDIINYVEVTAVPYVQTTSQERLYDSSTPIPIEAGETKTVTMEFDKIPAGVDITVKQSPNGFEIQNITVYSWGADVTVYSPNSGDFLLRADGYAYEPGGREIVIAQDEDSIAEHGKQMLQIKDNHLIQTREHAEYLANLVLQLMNLERPIASIQWKGHPALTLGDIIVVDTTYKQLKGFITKASLNYDGTILQDLSIRRIE